MVGPRAGQTVAGAAVRRAGRNGASLNSGTKTPTLSSQDVEERTRIYGKVPLPVPKEKPMRLGPQGRAALIPRILELRDQGLTWPRVAKELGVRTYQAELAFKEWKAKGRCACGNLGKYQPDPYQLETHGEIIHIFLCDVCKVGK